MEGQEARGYLSGHGSTLLILCLLTVEGQRAHASLDDLDRRLDLLLAGGILTNDPQRAAAHAAGANLVEGVHQVLQVGAGETEGGASESRDAAQAQITTTCETASQ